MYTAFNIVNTMVGCAIKGCNNKSGRDKVSFYRLPAVKTHEGPQMLEITTERRRAWLSAISREDLKNLENVYVCSNHFMQYRLVVACQYLLLILEKPAYEISKHDVDWAPCKNLGHNKVNMSTLQAASDRATRTKRRRQRIEEAVATPESSSENGETQSEQLSASTSDSESQSEQDNAVFATADMGTQTCVDNSEVLSRSKSVQTCPPQTSDVGVQTDDCHFFHEKNFLSDDANVHYYTGLPKLVCTVHLNLL